MSDRRRRADRRNLLDLAASLENAVEFAAAADRAEEAPSPVLALIALRVRQLEETVRHLL